MITKIITINTSEIQDKNKKMLKNAYINTFFLCMSMQQFCVFTRSITCDIFWRERSIFSLFKRVR